MPPLPQKNQWAPHAEKQFGQFTHALSKYLPGRMTQLRRTSAAIRALPGQARRRGKG